MRVIHVAPTQFGTEGLFGGGERYPLELARALASEVDCELISFGERTLRYREPGGLRVTVLRAPFHLSRHPAHPIAPGLVRALSRADIVHMHHMRSAPSRIAVVAARLRGQRTVVTDHGLQGGDWRGLLPRFFDRFLAVSAFSAREFRLPRARTRIVYGGADPVRYAPDPSLTREGVLFVGRVTPHKGIDRLISALPEGALLRIAGSEGHDPRPPESDYPQLLRRMAQRRQVDFLGPVSDGELPALYRQAQVLVLPSVNRTCYGREVKISELLGLVVLEAMSSGTPVICSRLGGLPEIVRHGLTGFLVEPGDVSELNHRLAQLLGDRELALRMGRNARELVQEEFTWQRCARRCLRAYHELLPPGGRGKSR